MEDRYIETHKTWNKIAQLYEDNFMDLSLYNDTYKKFCDLLTKKEASILEIGCGPGNITKNILALNPSLNILATDISSNMIELAKKNNPSIGIKVLDCKDIGKLKSKYDGIVCGFTITYLSKADCLKMISDVSHLLKNDGILYLSFVAGDYKNSGFISGGSGDRTYFYYHDIKAIKKELELNQMAIVDLIEKGYLKSDNTSEKHQIIIAKKRTSIDS